MSPKNRLITAALLIAVSLLLFEGGEWVWTGIDTGGFSQVSSPRQSEVMWRLLSRDR